MRIRISTRQPQEAPAEDHIRIRAGQLESMQRGPRQSDHLLRQAADDICGDGILVADAEHDRSEPAGRERGLTVASRRN